MAQLSGSDLNVKISTNSDTKGIDQAEGRLNRFSSTASKAVSVAKVLSGSLLAVGVAVGGFAVKSASEIESMNVALRTAFQGNDKLAKQAGKTITQFAAKTPFQINEVMRSFIKLKNMGLDPSNEALMAYGDTASAMGKSLNDMVEAVADAATGEFERLKEFGIRASSEGDRVKFTFQGVTTEVGKNSEEIEDYLIKLGKTKFSGGMAEQSKTLTGMLSTLGDTINITAAEFAQSSGLFDLAKTAVENLIPIIENADDTVAQIGATWSHFTGWIDKNREAIEVTAAVIGTIMLPQMVMLAAQITKNIALWTAHAAVALANNIAQAYMFVTSGWQMVAVLVAQAAKLTIAVASWTAYRTAMLITTLMTGGFTAATLAHATATGIATVATGALAAANWALTAALRANPVGLIITALIALGGVLIAATGNWDNFKNGVVNAISTAIDWIKGLIDWIGKIPLVQDIGNAISNIKVPGFASGTNFAPGGMALVGERGPELVNLPRGSQVIPNQQTNQVLSRAGVVIENFNMYASDAVDMTFGLERLDRTIAARLG